MSGLQRVLRSQENPDGEEGHRERQEMQDRSRKEPPKNKFIKKARGTRDPTQVITKADQRALDIKVMKERCDVYMPGCCLSQCHTCKRKNRLMKKDRDRSVFELRQKKVREDRPEYYLLYIAFNCPITGKKHLIGDCFAHCVMWGRTFPAALEGKPLAVLYCELTCGKRELHSGNITAEPGSEYVW